MTQDQCLKVACACLLLAALILWAYCGGCQ